MQSETRGKPHLLEKPPDQVLPKPSLESGRYRKRATGRNHRAIRARSRLFKPPAPQVSRRANETRQSVRPPIRIYYPVWPGTLYIHCTTRYASRTCRADVHSAQVGWLGSHENFEKLPRQRSEPRDPNTPFMHSRSISSTRVWLREVSVVIMRPRGGNSKSSDGVSE